MFKEWHAEQFPSRHPCRRSFWVPSRKEGCKAERCQAPIVVSDVMVESIQELKWIRTQKHSCVSNNCGACDVRPLERPRRALDADGTAHVAIAQLAKERRLLLLVLVSTRLVLAQPAMREHRQIRQNTIAPSDRHPEFVTDCV